MMAIIKDVCASPLEAPIKKPCGPFLEIVQPGTGSFHAAVTKK
jgi:hypothetical protein